MIFAGERGTLEFEIKGLASQQLWVDTHGAPLWRADADSSVEAALFITRDITERVAAENSDACSKSSCANHKRWKRSGDWPEASRTISTTCSRSFRNRSPRLP